MSIQIIEQPGTIAGRIGKGLAAGLSEQLPKEIGRQRLSAGLKSLEGQNLNPLQQTQSLLKSGASPEEISQLIPLLQQAQGRKALEERVKGRKEVVSKEAPKAQEMGEQKTTLGRLSPEQITAYKSKIKQEPNQAQIENLANQYLGEGLAFSADEAKQKAYSELKREFDVEQSKLNNLTNDLSKRMSLELQNAGLGSFKDISGEIQQALLDRAQNNVIQEGMTPEESSKNISDIITELGKTAAQTKALQGKWSQSPAEKIRALKEQKDEFKKYGFGEIFDDLATSALGITDLKTASILDPIKNPEITKAIPKKDRKRGFVVEMGKKELDNLIDKIGINDNLLSVAYELRNKKYNVNQFLERVRQLSDEGKKPLSPHQRRQLKKSVSNSIFGDIWFSARE